VGSGVLRGDERRGAGGIDGRETRRDLRASDPDPKPDRAGGNPMPWIDYREVRRRIPMSRVLELLNWEPDTRRGDQLRGPCPIHSGDGRSVFAVYLGKQVYFCH
jgi:hypothetical protein